ncbi:MAG: NUDIX domain-containing protein, partial [Candidatus Microsaccharimonas sp.]
MTIKNSELNCEDSTVGEYIQSTYEAHGKFIDDDEYSTMLDSVVLTCVDVLICVDDKIVLVDRLHEPQPGLWLLGGRMQAGEQLYETAVRHMKQEVGLVVALDRFEYL